MPQFLKPTAQLYRLIVILLPMTFSLAGCGGGSHEKPTASLSGIVLYNGKPVTGGTLMFDPKGTSDALNAGKPGAAVIQEDGTFTVSTYHDGDGAVIGTHMVSYAPPPPESKGKASTSSGDASGGSQMIPSPFEGLVTEQNELVVEADANNVVIKLMKPKSTKGRSAR